MRNLRAALQKVETGLPIVECPELASSVHWSPAENIPVHRWFRYREGFSPSLLDHFQGTAARLDPFCGCGTTLLDSARRGVPSCGSDLSPLATFVATIKTRVYSREDRVKFTRAYQDVLANFSSLRPAPRPPYPLLKKLFLPQSLDSLLRIKSYIDHTGSARLRDLLKLAWLSILERSSNVFKEGNGLKYRNKKRQPGRYDTVPDHIWIPRYFGKSVRKFVLDLWSEKCTQIADDIESFQFARGFAPTIRTGSSFDSDTLRFGRKFGLVVFSPPYANRFDYFETFKIELWMGDFVRSYEDLLSLRWKSMRGNLGAARYKGEAWAPLKPFLAMMDEKASSVRMGIKPALEGYFYDMRVLLRNLRAVTTKRAKIVIVVGNSAYAKSIVPTDALIARLGQEEEYAVHQVKVARPLHVSSQQRSSLVGLERFMRESVVVLEAL